jgi:hypothetical protein
LWNEKLSAQKKFTLEKIGIFSLDVERNLQFQPDENVNYLLDSFGLATFQSSPIKCETPQQKIEKKFIDRAAIPQEKRKINVRKYVALALVLPLAFSVWWITTQTESLKNVNYSNLNPFASKEKALYKESNMKIPDFSFSEGKINLSDTEEITFLKLSDEGKPIAVRMKEISEVHPDKTAITKSAFKTSELSYHVIGGCFQIQENAIKYVEQLRRQNINASIIGQNRIGLYIVSCANFSSRDEAVAELGKIKSSVNDGAWLLKK